MTTAAADTAICTNATLGAALQLSHSTVSRMRTGHRMGSIDTLERIAAAARIPIADVVAARRKCREGDPEDWNVILDQVCVNAAE